MGENSIAQKHFFKFELSSPLFRLSLNKASRFYLDKTAHEIIKETLKFHTLQKEVNFENIKNRYPKFEYLCQCRESDFDFLKCICYNNRIYFYEDEKTIYFYDFIDIHSLESRDIRKENIKNVIFNSNPNNNLNEERISSIIKNDSLFASSFTHSLQNSLYPLTLNSFKSNQARFGNKDSFSYEYNLYFHLEESSFSFEDSLSLTSRLREIRSIIDLNTFTAKSNIFDVELNQTIRTKDVNF